MKASYLPRWLLILVILSLTVTLPRKASKLEAGGGGYTVCTTRYSKGGVESNITVYESPPSDGLYVRLNTTAQLGSVVTEGVRVNGETITGTLPVSATVYAWFSVTTPVVTTYTVTGEVHTAVVSSWTYTGTKQYTAWTLYYPLGVLDQDVVVYLNGDEIPCTPTAKVTECWPASNFVISAILYHGTQFSAYVATTVGPQNQLVEITVLKGYLEDKPYDVRVTGSYPPGGSAFERPKSETLWDVGVSWVGKYTSWYYVEYSGTFSSTIAKPTLYAAYKVGENQPFVYTPCVLDGHNDERPPAEVTPTPMATQTSTPTVAWTPTPAATPTPTHTPIPVIRICPVDGIELLPEVSWTKSEPNAGVFEEGEPFTLNRDTTIKVWAAVDDQAVIQRSALGGFADYWTDPFSPMPGQNLNWPSGWEHELKVTLPNGTYRFVGRDTHEGEGNRFGSLQIIGACGLPYDLFFPLVLK